MLAADVTLPNLPLRPRLPSSKWGWLAGGAAFVLGLLYFGSSRAYDRLEAAELEIVAMKKQQKVSQSQVS